MKTKLWDIPITHPINPHTGYEAGDDTFAIDNTPLYPDALVRQDGLAMVAGIKVYPVYHLGAHPRICPQYGNGIGASPVMMLRAPMVRTLLEVDKLVHELGFGLLGLDAGRSRRTQSRCWQECYKPLLGGQELSSLSVEAFLNKGLLAHKIGCYASVAQDSVYHSALEQLRRSQTWSQIETAGVNLTLGTDKVAELYLTFLKNWESNDLSYDLSKNSGHGAYASIDLILYALADGLPVNMGTYFDEVMPEDFTGMPITHMGFFENDDNFPIYEEFVAKGRDSLLNQYLNECGVGKITRQVFEHVRRNRRVVFNGMMAKGFSHFNLENYHFNGDNLPDGIHAADLPGAGCVYHSYLMGIPYAVYGDEYAQKQAAELGVF